MPNNRVTVALPVYNGMPHLPAAVESVLNQTYENIELVIIDDGSSDDTAEYLKSIDDPRVTLSPNPQNLGVEGAWNRALDQAKNSPYFKLMCADDLLYPHCIATEVAALDAHEDVVMTASKRVIVDDRGDTLVKSRGLAGMVGVVDGKAAVRRSVLCGTNVLGEPPAVMLRSSATEGLRFDATHKLLIDFDLWAQVLQRGKMFAIPTPLCVFRVGGMSDSLQTVKKHRAMQIGEFMKLADVPSLDIGKARLYAGVAMATGIATARQVFYKWVDVRDRKKSLT